MIACGLALSAFWGVVSQLLPVVTDGDRQAQAQLVRLRIDVDQREQEFRTAKHALLAARGRLALAEGRRGAAAGYYRELVSGREAAVRRLERMIRHGRVCLTEMDYRMPHGELAIARCGLAEAEGRLDVLAPELSKVIDYLKCRIRDNTLLHERRVLPPEETVRANEELVATLRRAERKLKAVKKELRRATKAK